MTLSEYRKIFPSKNFLTPTVIRYGEINNIFYELSEGNGISNERIWGVTIHDVLGNNTDRFESKAFSSLNEAEQYIKIEKLLRV